MSTMPGTGHLAVLTEYFADVLDSIASGGTFTVWAMGGDAKLRLELIGKISGNATLGSIGTRLDAAADRVEQALLNLDQQVLVSETDRLAWSASLIGDCSPYATDLQLNTARYLLMDEIVRAGGRHLFFVESDIVALAFERTAKLNSLPMARRGGKIKPPQRVEALRARVSALKSHLRQAGTLKKLRRSCPAPWAKLAECDVILIDWAGSLTFSAGGETMRAGNLVRMADVLRGAGLRVGFVAYPLSWTQPYEAIAANVVAAHDPVVLTDECRGIGSILRGAWATWRMGRRLKKAKFQASGCDLSPLIDLERIRDNIRPQSTLAYSFVDVAKVLAGHGVHPGAIVYPFENQGWERALGEGVRHHLPHTRLVAYQHAPFAKRYIGFFPPHSDILAGRLADKLVVMGPHYLELFRNHGWPHDRLVLGGSLRFEPALKNPPLPAQYGGKTVLAATSIDFTEALDLAVKGGLAVSGIVDARLVVNFHPVVDQNFHDAIRDGLLKALGAEGLQKVMFSNASAADLVNDASVLLYNNSGAVFDACFSGVPTVYVAVDGRLSYDKAPDGTSQRVLGGNDLQDLLMDIFKRPSRRLPDMTVGGIIAAVDETAIVTAVIG